MNTRDTHNSCCMALALLLVIAGSTIAYHIGSL